MDNNYKTCYECGRAITTKKGAFYNPSLNAYTCPICLASIKADPVCKVGGFKAYWKLLLGLLLLVLSTVFFWTESDILILLSFPLLHLGILFLILHSVTYKRMQRNAVVKYQAERHSLRQEQLKAEMDAEMDYSKPWKCPACGASTIGRCCEYCDSPYKKADN